MMDWIPATESMPHNQQRVLIAYTNRFGATKITMGWYCTSKAVEAERFDGEVNDEYDEATDTYYLKEQWVNESQESEYHYPIRNVTHWMPLPEAPKPGEK